MHEVLVNRLGGLSLSRKSVVRLTDRPDVKQQSNNNNNKAFEDDKANPKKGSTVIGMTTILVLIQAPALNAPCLFSENNEI